MLSVSVSVSALLLLSSPVSGLRKMGAMRDRDQRSRKKRERRAHEKQLELNAALEQDKQSDAYAHVRHEVVNGVALDAGLGMHMHELSAAEEAAHFRFHESMNPAQKQHGHGHHKACKKWDCYGDAQCAEDMHFECSRADECCEIVCYDAHSCRAAEVISKHGARVSIDCVHREACRELVVFQYGAGDTEIFAHCEGAADGEAACERDVVADVQIFESLSEKEKNKCDIFLCADGECADHEFVCCGSCCDLFCHGDGSCRNTTLHCAHGDCGVTCGGDGSCRDLDVYSHHHLTAPTLERKNKLRMTRGRHGRLQLEERHPSHANVWCVHDEACENVNLFDVDFDDADYTHDAWAHMCRVDHAMTGVYLSDAALDAQQRREAAASRSITPALLGFSAFVALCAFGAFVFFDARRSTLWLKKARARVLYAYGGAVNRRFGFQGGSRGADNNYFYV